MMNEVVRIIKFFSVVCATLLIINQKVYCVIPYIRVVDVYIADNNPTHKPNWRIYSDDESKFRLSLSTICLEKSAPKIKATDELLDGEEPIDNDVEYRCIPEVKKKSTSASTSVDVDERAKVMIEAVCIDGNESSISLDMQNPESAISCPPGQPLAVKVTKLNEIGNPNFDNYRYRGILFAEEGVIEETIVEIKNSTLEAVPGGVLVKKNLLSDQLPKVRPRSGSSSRAAIVSESRIRSISNANIKNSPLMFDTSGNIEDGIVERENITPVINSPFMSNIIGLSVLSSGNSGINDLRTSYTYDRSKKNGSPRRSPSPIPSRSISPGARDIIEAKKKQKDKDIVKDDFLMKNISEEERNKKIRLDVQEFLISKSEVTMWIPLKLVFNQSKLGLIDRMLNSILNKGED